MSYILEALKKSQQERELGHVPTLETPVFSTEERGTRQNIWVLSAVILAALAVLIALYAALRGVPSAPESVETAGLSPRPAGPENANQGKFSTLQEPLEPTSAQPESAASVAQDAAGAPPLKDLVPPEVPDSATAREIPIAPAATGRPARQPPVPKKQTGGSTHQQAKVNKIPPDLIADIEAFKREVREEQSGMRETGKAETKIAPQDLRLPKDVRKRLPELIMSAHIFDEEPSKRFVLINGLKTREGEESREKITVEKILPDGAILSFDGHKFFQHR